MINKIFKYAGNKEFIINIINDFIKQYCNNYEIYIEPFLRKSDQYFII